MHQAFRCCALSEKPRSFAARRPDLRESHCQITLKSSRSLPVTSSFPACATAVSYRTPLCGLLVSRSEFECLLRDDLFADAIVGLDPATPLTWRSTIVHDNHAQLMLLHSAIATSGARCDDVVDGAPLPSQSSFTYRIDSTVAQVDRLVTKLGDIYELEHSHESRGSSYSLLGPNGRCLL